MSQPTVKPSSSSDNFANFPLGRGVTVLKRDACGIIAFDKPAGVLSHPNSRADEDRALLTCAYEDEEQYFQWSDPSTGNGRKLWLLNRLDSATSGVILVADSAPVAAVIRAAFKHKHIRKIYNALVFGTPSVPNQVWRDRLSVDKSGGQVRSAAAGHIPCECGMSLLSKRGGGQVLSLLRLEPRTGRSHQLRVQCAKRGLPIVGDATYGDFGANRIFAKAQHTKRLFLHSLETSFEYEHSGKIHRFSVAAPLPEDFANALRAAGARH